MSLNRVQSVPFVVNTDNNLILTANLTPESATESINLSISNSISVNSISTNSPFTLDGYSITTSSAHGSIVLLFNGKPVTTCGSRVLIGTEAGLTNQGNYAIAMGYLAGHNNQGQVAVAIGDQAGKIKQGNYAIAVGFAAGESKQGANSVAIGTYAGQYNQANNSIVINATGNSLVGNTASAFYVKPVRSVTGATSKGFVAVFYNPTTGEFVYGTP